MTQRIALVTRSLALLLLSTAALLAATVDWQLGRAVDCPLPLALPSKAATRTVVFPAAITEVPSFWSDEQLFVKPLRNTLILQLRDPTWTGTIQVFDDKGNLYLLNARAVKPAEVVDELMILKPITAGSGIPGTAPLPTDSDSAISDMMAYMTAGGSNPNYTGSLVTRAVDGKLVIGRRLFEDDTLVLDLVKIFQGPSYHGYETVLRYRGTKTVRINLQSLKFRGALAVYATNQVVYDTENPGVDMNPNQAVQIFYVAE